MEGYENWKTSKHKGKNKPLFLKCYSPLANNKFYSALCTVKTLEIIYTYKIFNEVLHETKNMITYRYHVKENKSSIGASCT